MPLRKLNVRDIKPFDYAFEPPIAARMADVGRTLGSDTIGLTIQTVPPGNSSSRRHRHLFQEEILIVMSVREPCCTATKGSTLGKATVSAI